MSNVNTIRTGNELVQKDKQIIDQYLELTGRSGSNVRKGNKSEIYQCLTFIGKECILDIDEFDIEEYFQSFEAKGLKHSTKKTKRAKLNSFFNHYYRKMRRTNPTYYNPIPTLKECKFRKDEFLTIEQQQQQHNKECFTTTQLKDILKKTYFNRQDYFIAQLLLTFCGMRVSECMSIRLENINLEERYLLTGIEENCKKSNKPLYFCYPKIIVPFLREYIINLKQKHPNNIWLFKGNKDKYASPISFGKFLKEKFQAKTHTFRKTIETNQIKNECPLYIVELLSNHAISSVVMKHYNVVSKKERLRLYDKYLPPQYQDIISLLKQL